MTELERQYLDDKTFYNQNHRIHFELNQLKQVF